MCSLNLYELRKEKGITQSELAEMLGVSFQTISKWENGVTIPDVKNVIAMAEFFDVTTDQILGLQPIKYSYYSRKTASSEYWNEKLDYIRSSRENLWNRDYMEFLIQKVWNIRHAVNIIDFGCGNGYLAGLMLPFLPKGSTYTGIDISDVLIRDAKSTYLTAKNSVRFQCENIYKYKSDQKYDIVICQTFLRELPDPKMALKKMVSFLKPDGMIVCIEVNRELENAGFYIEGLNYANILDTEIQRKYWVTEYENMDRDYAIGMRIPFYLREFGLKDIAVRMQDKVIFADPSKEEEYEKFRESYLVSKGDERRFVDVYVNHGLTKSEAEKNAKTRKKIREKIVNEGKAFLKSTGLLITYGYKKD